MTPCTLYEALATLPDPHSRHGRVYPLPAVLGLVTLVLLMGRKSLKSIAWFGRQHKAPLAHALGFRRGKTPSTSTLSRNLRRFDAAQLEAVLSHWVRARVDPETFEQILLDGKTLRGSRDAAVLDQHLIAAYAPAVRAVLAQIRVDSRTNEHKAALELLGILPVTGKVVVGDAMFCPRDLAEQVVGTWGDYLLVVKDNQPGLEIDIRAGFTFEHAARNSAAATSPWGHPSDGPGGSGCHQDREGTRPGREANAGDDADPDGRAEVKGTEAGVEDHPWANRQGCEIGGGGIRDHESVGGAANAKTLLALLRDHWQIENGLHYVRDMWLGEDACRVRSGTAAHVLVGLRNAVIHRLAGVGAESRPEAIEILQLHPVEARRLIGNPQWE